MNIFTFNYTQNKTISYDNILSEKHLLETDMPKYEKEILRIV